MECIYRDIELTEILTEDPTFIEKYNQFSKLFDVGNNIKCEYPSRLPKKEYVEYTRDELITVFLPLVENIARKFATSQQASGVMSIMDLIKRKYYKQIFYQPRLAPYGITPCVFTSHLGFKPSAITHSIFIIVLLVLYEYTRFDHLCNSTPQSSQSKLLNNHWVF